MKRQQVTLRRGISAYKNLERALELLWYILYHEDMDERDYSFVRDCPELVKLVDGLLSPSLNGSRQEVFLIVETTFRAGVANGIAKALKELGLIKR